VSDGPLAHAGRSSNGPAFPVVPRKALFERLSRGVQAGVTLVVAAPGSGKTVLLRSWIEHSGLDGQVAWVTVERDEYDPQRFWLSVVEQLRTVTGADSFIEKLTPSPDFRGEAVVERLVTELGLCEQPLVLVIDNLQELSSQEASRQLEMLLAHRPPVLRVVLATRWDPHLGLHRLRLSGELVEIREHDMRFTLEETRDLLASAQIKLSEESVSLLHARTEGWAAGLRLAALSLAGHPDPDHFVAAFSGSERTVAEYLLAEVLERQPDETRRLLLRTSILDRVNGALADTLLEVSGSERILFELEQQSLFVVSLDAHHSWFRYHRLFGDLLRLELRRTDPTAVPELHRLAADWFGTHGFVIEAIRHAQAAEDWGVAARLLAEQGLGLFLDGEEMLVRGLLAAFPPGFIPDPELVLLFAFRDFTEGSYEGAVTRIVAAESRAETLTAERRQRFDIVLAILKLTLARTRGDFASVLGLAQQLRESLEKQAEAGMPVNEDGQAVALMNLGVVELWSSHMEEAEKHLQQAVELARRIDRPYIVVTCLSHLAAIITVRSYTEARELCAQAIAISDAQGWAATRVECVAVALTSIIDTVQGRFEEAEQWLRRAERSLRANVEPATALLVLIGRGMLDLALGRLDDALVVLGDVDGLQAMLVTPHILTVQARRFLVQTQVKLGQIEAARATLATFSDEERKWGEADLATAALSLVEGDSRGAVNILAPVLAEAAPVLRDLSLIEALLLDAIAHDRLGERQAAESDIERALDCAEPDAIIFPFVLIPARDLLERHPRYRTAHAGLLSVILDFLSGHGPPPPLRRVTEPAEELSDSEVRVLRYLSGNLSAPEIASELYLSTSTVKTHMRHIYGKLGVHTRTEAVERARQLGLLGPSTRGRR
jgi:LuxR family transcriptional regulator, maltose regulon positive regulatory protein